MTIEEIREKVKSIEGIGGMKVNERLFGSGFMELFDKSKIEDKKFARSILRELKVDDESIKRIVPEQ